MSLATWLTDSDELPHEPADVPGWSENYLTQAWSPSTEIGIYFHLCHKPGRPDIWENQFVAYLPGDRFLVSRGSGPADTETGVRVGPVQLTCDKPFVQWSNHFRGDCRLVTGEELRAGPLTDGPVSEVEMLIRTTAMSPAYDLGGARIAGQSWGHGHYEQNYEAEGYLAFQGQEIPIAGTGLRDHSWGPRDWSKTGNTVWVHGQFPDSGRSFMVLTIPGVAPVQPFHYAVLNTRDSIEVATFETSPVCDDIRQAETEGYTLRLTTESGRTEVIRAEMLTAVRMAWVDEHSIAMGQQIGPHVHNDYTEAMTRYEWDGEIGYGLSERTVAR